MRTAGIGLLLVGAIVTGLGVVVAEGSGIQTAIIGGCMFVAGAVFAAGAGIQDALKRAQ